MAIYMKKKANSQDLERMFLEASYSGERFVIQQKDGIAVGIVPIEDVQILEELEEEEKNLPCEDQAH